MNEKHQISKITKKNVLIIGIYGFIFILFFLITILVYHFEAASQWAQDLIEQKKAYNLFYKHMKNNLVNDLDYINVDSVLIIKTNGDIFGDSYDYIVAFYLGDDQFDYCPIYLDDEIDKQCKYKSIN